MKKKYLVCMWELPAFSYLFEIHLYKIDLLQKGDISHKMRLISSIKEITRSSLTRLFSLEHEIHLILWDQSPLLTKSILWRWISSRYENAGNSHLYMRFFSSNFLQCRAKTARFWTEGPIGKWFTKKDAETP